MLRTHQGRANRATIPADDIAVLQNEQVVYVPDDNHRNYSRDISQTSARPTERLLQSSWCIEWAGGQDLRCAKILSWGQKKVASISPFQNYPVIPRIFIEASVAQFFSINFQKNPIHFPTSFQNFPTKSQVP